MFVGRNYPIRQTIGWSKNYILTFVLLSSLPVFIYRYTDVVLAVPWLPVSLIGTAVAFYLGFKNNASYDRLWEARKIWGAIINSSRTFGMMVKGYVRKDFEVEEGVRLVQERLIKRHLAWLHALRFQLRTRRAWEHKRPPSKGNKHLPVTEEQTLNVADVLQTYLSKQELNAVMGKQNGATHLLEFQMDDLTRLRKANLIEDFRHMELGNLLKELNDRQGECERIKNFPFPRQYASLNVYFVWLFILLLPFGLIQEFAKMGEQYVWLTIPFSVLVSWVFHTMEMIGDYSENPFEGLNNDGPITAIARTIEIDLLEMLGEKEIPQPILPKEKVLM